MPVGEDYFLVASNPKKWCREVCHLVYCGVRKRDSNKWVCEAREGFVEWESYKRVSDES